MLEEADENKSSKQKESEMKRATRGKKLAPFHRGAAPFHGGVPSVETVCLACVGEREGMRAVAVDTSCPRRKLKPKFVARFHRSRGRLCGCER